MTDFVWLKFSKFKVVFFLKLAEDLGKGRENNFFALRL